MWRTSDPPCSPGYTHVYTLDESPSDICLTHKLHRGFRLARTETEAYYTGESLPIHRVALRPKKSLSRSAAAWVPQTYHVEFSAWWIYWIYIHDPSFGVQDFRVPDLWKSRNQAKAQMFVFWNLLKTMAKRVVSHFGSKILPFSIIIEHHETALNNSSFLP